MQLGVTIFGTLRINSHLLVIVCLIDDLGRAPSIQTVDGTGRFAKRMCPECAAYTEVTERPYIGAVYSWIALFKDIADILMATTNASSLLCYLQLLIVVCRSGMSPQCHSFWFSTLRCLTLHSR